MVLVKCRYSVQKLTEVQGEELTAPTTSAHAPSPTPRHATPFLNFHEVEWTNETEVLGSAGFFQVSSILAEVSTLMVVSSLTSS